MLHWARSACARFSVCENGSFGVIFALLLAPVLALGGMALDYARMSAAEDRLQAAVDASILAAAASGGRTSDMQLLAADLIAANVDAEQVDVETIVDSHEIRIEARYELDMAMLALVGKPSHEIIASAKLISAERFTGGRTKIAGNASTPARSISARRSRRGGAPFYLAR